MITTKANLLHGKFIPLVQSFCFHIEKYIYYGLEFKIEQQLDNKNGT